MKKKLCLILASVMTVSMLATGCGEKDPGTSENPTGERPEGVEITMGRKVVTNAMLPEGQTPEDNAYLWKTEEELKIDIVDEFNGVDADYDQKVSMAIASGDIPDIMRVSTFAEVYELYENEMIAPLDDVYEEYACDRIKEKYNSFPEGLGLDRARIDGELYAIPGAGGDCAPMICFLRSDWFDDIEFEVDPDGDRVISYLDVIEIARQFMAADPAGTGNMVGISTFNDLIWREGEGAWCLNFIANAVNAWPDTWFVNDAGELVYGSVQPEVKEFLKICNDLYEEGILDPQVGTREWDDVTELMVNGRFGMAFGAGHTPSWGLINVYTMDPNTDYKCFLISDENGIVRHKHSDSAETGYLVVSSDCEYPEVAVEMINLWDGYNESEEVAFYAADERLQELRDVGSDRAVGPYRLTIGSYTANVKNAQLKQDYLDGVKTADECIEQNAYFASWVEAYDAFMAAGEDGELEPKYWAEYTAQWEAYSLCLTLDQYEKAEWLTPVFPTITDSRWSTLDDLVMTTYLGMIKGEIDIDAEWDKFVQEWNEIGGAEITEEAAKALGIK